MTVLNTEKKKEILSYDKCRHICGLLHEACKNLLLQRYQSEPDMLSSLGQRATFIFYKCINYILNNALNYNC